MTWDIEKQTCDQVVGGYLKISADSFLLINASEDRLIIDSTLWNEENNDNC